MNRQRLRRQQQLEQDPFPGRRMNQRKGRRCLTTGQVIKWISRSGQFTFTRTYTSGMTWHEHIFSGFKLLCFLVIALSRPKLRPFFLSDFVEPGIEIKQLIIRCTVSYCTCHIAQRDRYLPLKIRKIICIPYTFYSSPVAAPAGPFCSQCAAQWFKSTM